VPLELYSSYSREDVHDFYDPKSTFKVGTGSWGIHGIIRVPERRGDFVLFVTLGKKEREHQFDESINEEGILRWQSQPHQDLNSSAIRELVRHDEKTNNVYLFLRASALRGGVAETFTYLGTLKYAGHDLERINPVHIAWELMEWPIPPEVLSSMRLSLVKETDNVRMEPDTATPRLIEEAPPIGRESAGETSRAFLARKMRYQSSDQSRALGLAGELLVLERERLKLGSVVA
jgi:hypothetical protein